MTFILNWNKVAQIINSLVFLSNLPLNMRCIYQQLANKMLI